MRTAGRLCAVLAALAMCAALGAAVEAVAEEPKGSGWYVGAGVGMGRISDMRQAGRNRDTTCYPNDDCTRIGGSPEGYRWFYDLDADSGVALDIAIGRAFNQLRLELSLAQRKNDLKQKFHASSYLDGSPIASNPESNYASSSTASADSLTTRTLSLNAYYDFPLPQSRFTPYLGAGVGLSFVRLSKLYYRSRYRCRNPASDCDRPEQYDSLEEVDLSDTVFSKHLHAGVDYRLRDAILLGLKFSYSMVDDMEDENRYDRHPIPGLASVTKISDMDHWSLMFAVKYFFGD